MEYIQTTIKPCPERTMNTELIIELKRQELMEDLTCLGCSKEYNYAFEVARGLVNIRLNELKEELNPAQTKDGI